ncbi:MAG: amidase [Phenylobacterium sp.]|uniref:amidase family protein n=1 Tax=Phenylobacterium sp. TaxID=1871053 RepID=UPI001A1CC6FC|nr:amidase family protein [Phenylobacterium sp.]MBJ7411183.1 amidase [Phenylobacterium sp.]
MGEFLDQDATSQLIALASKRVSAVELLKAALARHAQTHGDLNAVVAADPERALERARALDDARVRGEPLGPLAGLPMTVKDTFDVSGMAASSGLPELRRRMTEDAAAVGHARRAGAIVWGKTNVPVMAADWQSANPLYGATNNPWDLKRTPGGSSGGAAAALAARVTPLEIGSDIGGSLRVPASFCGVFSHKPTWGLVSQRGHVPPSPGSHAERDLNVIGPMARSARDLRLLLSVIENGPRAPKADPAYLKETRIGLWLDDPLCPLDSEVRGAIQAFADQLREAGVEVETIPSPVDMRALLHAYMTLLGGVLGEDLPPKTLRGMERMRFLMRGQVERAGPLSNAAMVMAYTARHREWMAADAVRARLRTEIAGAFERWHAILAPIAPVAAFPHDRRPFQRRTLATSDGRTLPYNSMLTWISVATALRLPATAVPVGFTAGGLPVGAQLIGPHAGDARTLAIAQAIDENIRGYVAPPL